jgi:SAM-dependent MidA family methyltransferase
MTDDGPRLGLRRPADLAPRQEPGHEPELLSLIQEEIRASGPMTFARFMDLALYHPALGYYATGQRGPGRAADFLTAPESHPIFGWSIAVQLEEVWERLGRPAPFTVRELGAGTGALAAGILDGLIRIGSPLCVAIRYRVAERSPDRERQVRERLAAIGAADVLEPEDGRPIRGAVIANEVLDALPVHRVVGGPNGSLLELFVALGPDGGLVAAGGTPSTPALASRLAGEGVRLVAGQVAEICLAVEGWVSRAADGLESGLLLLIDYGHPAARLYDPSRGSLLRAYLGHRVHDDPFRNVGRQDLTAHVDLTAVERAALTAGLTRLGTTTQAEFLAGLGLAERLVALQAGGQAELGAYLEARSAVVRLLDPTATGRFAVMLFGRDLPAEPALRGLSYRMRGRPPV